MTGHIDQIKASARASLGVISEAIGQLQLTGVIEILKTQAQPVFIPSKTENFLETKACQYDYLRGYHTALFNLLNFKDVFLSETTGPDAPQFDFGAIDMLQASGALTKEEADAIRRGEEPPKLERIDGRTLDAKSGKA